MVYLANVEDFLLPYHLHNVKLNFELIGVNTKQKCRKIRCVISQKADFIFK